MSGSDAGYVVEMDAPRVVAREARSMTRAEVIRMALAGTITWVQAGQILGLTARHVFRLRLQYEKFGVPGLRDKRSGRRMPTRTSLEVVEEVCRLKQDKYPDFSVRHFHERLTEKHGVKISYTQVLTVLQARGLVKKAPARGKHRRKRDRRPMRGMMVHLDASSHAWIAGLPPMDLVVALDDADGAILFAQFFAEEGTHSTFVALEHVLTRYGRFGELYTDRGSHFCLTPKADGKATIDHNGQVSRALKTLGIQQVLAYSPEARGRSERAFGTLQGRLPQELRLEGITDYDAANRYLNDVFIADFNRRFTVEPPQPQIAFVRLGRVDVRLVLSRQHERVVKNDNTVTFGGLTLQLPKLAGRMHLVRCAVLVHELCDDTLAVSFQGQAVARYRRDGSPLPIRVQHRA